MQCIRGSETAANRRRQPAATTEWRASQLSLHSQLLHWCSLLQQPLGQQVGTRMASFSVCLPSNADRFACSARQTAAELPLTNRVKQSQKHIISVARYSSDVMLAQPALPPVPGPLQARLAGVQLRQLAVARRQQQPKAAQHQPPPAPAAPPQLPAWRQQLQPLAVTRCPAFRPHRRLLSCSQYSQWCNRCACNKLASLVSVVCFERCVALSSCSFCVLWRSLRTPACSWTQCPSSPSSTAHPLPSPSRSQTPPTTQVHIFAFLCRAHSELVLLTRQRALQSDHLQ